MSLFSIKLIAILAMANDHLGAFVVEDNFYFRLLGRLAFPLFSWAIANGGVYTKNIYKYLLRIFILAIVSQVPYQLLFISAGVTNPGLNILFTFFLALCAIAVFKKTKNLIVRYLSVLILAVFAHLINADYGAFGVLSVIVFYKYFDSKIKTVFAFTMLVLIFFVMPVFANKIFGNVFEVNSLNLLETFSIFSLVFITTYNQKIGYKLKYFFYAFYPIHLFAIYLIKVALES